MKKEKGSNKTCSLILDIISEHRTDWREYFDTNYPSIKIKTCGVFAIFNYSIGADFNDPVVREARGIILNVATFEVVCFPFTKFGKWNESYADTDKIKWKTARVQDKLDGSIIKLWYSEPNEDWVWSTNSMIYAEHAYCDEFQLTTFMDLIKQTENYHIIKQNIDENKLSKDYTYIFELITPQNQVVINYTASLLWHIGTRNNITGKELSIDIGIVKPYEYPLHSLDECINYANNVMNKISDTIDCCRYEGFVVVDKYYNRIKIKSPIYMVLHNIFSQDTPSKEQLIQFIHEDMIDIDSICEEFPKHAHYLRYYSFKYIELINRLTAFVNIARHIYSVTDKKTVANKIKNHKYSSIAFKALDNDDSVIDIMSKMNGGIIKQISKLIPTYEPENFNYLFEEGNDE